MTVGCKVRKKETGEIGRFLFTKFRPLEGRMAIFTLGESMDRWEYPYKQFEEEYEEITDEGTK
jgi:hypothetical protein